MPDTFTALAIFAASIVPGYLVQRGYLRSRAHGIPETDLEGLAASVVWSAVVLACAWPFAGVMVVHWIENGKVDAHLSAMYALSLALVVVPYPAGFAIGAAAAFLATRVSAFREARAAESGFWGRTFGVLDTIGVFSAPTVWDGMWTDLWSSELYVLVRTKTGQSIVGVFGTGSLVGMSPSPAQPYLSTVYRENPPGSRQMGARAAIEGSVHRCV